jgi:hypothetical protein
MLAGRSWPTDNGTCTEQQRKEDRVAYRQTSRRLVKLPLGVELADYTGFADMSQHREHMSRQIIDCIEYTRTSTFEAINLLYMP